MLPRCRHPCRAVRRGDRVIRAVVLLVVLALVIKVARDLALGR